jgi:alpha-tubulin suppressor-like RCC1 family protein
LGTGKPSSIPLQVQHGEAGPLKELAAGFQHTCAVNEDLRIYCWGRNDYGQLGRGTSSNFDNDIREVDGEFSTVTAKGMRTCALDLKGQAYCWGQESAGKMEVEGLKRLSTVPTKIDHEMLYRRISTGYLHTCAVTPTGLTDCWGRNTSGEVGIGSTESPILYPRPVRW